MTTLPMEKGLKKSEKDNWPISDIININGNIITIKLTRDTGYSYSFFNDVVVSENFDVVEKKGFYFSVTEKP